MLIAFKLLIYYSSVIVVLILFWQNCTVLYHISKLVLKTFLFTSAYSEPYATLSLSLPPPPPVCVYYYYYYY